MVGFVLLLALFLLFFRVTFSLLFYLIQLIRIFKFPLLAVVFVFVFAFFSFVTFTVSLCSEDYPFP